MTFKIGVTSLNQKSKLKIFWFIFYYCHTIDVWDEMSWNTVCEYLEIQNLGKLFGFILEDCRYNNMQKEAILNAIFHFA